MKSLKAIRQLVRDTLHQFVRLPMSEREMVDLLRKHGIEVMIGAQYSVRCQFGQIAEVIRDVERERYAGVQWRPLCGLNAKFSCNHKMINGECEVRECPHQIQSNISIDARPAWQPTKEAR